MQKHIIDLFKQDRSVTEILVANDIRYILIHNLLLEVDANIVIDVTIMQKATVDSTAFYYYDMLEPLCLQSDVDFSSLLIELLNCGIITDDLIEVK